MKHRNVITLTELIIIFVTVFVALMIILPVLYDYEPPDYRVKCASQLRGLGNALAMYHYDFNDKYPIVWSDMVVKAGFGTGWYNAKGSNMYSRWYDPTWKDWDKQPTVGGVCFCWSSMRMCTQKPLYVPVIRMPKRWICRLRWN